MDQWIYELSKREGIGIGTADIFLDSLAYRDVEWEG